MLKRILLCVIVFVLGYAGIQIIPSFFQNHMYYLPMVGNIWNIGLLLSGIILSCMPLIYMYWRSKKKNIGIVILLFLLAVWLFSILYISIQSSYHGWWFNLFVHLTFLIGLISYFLTSLLSVWITTYIHIFGRHPETIFQFLLSFWWWLIVFLLIIQLLILSGLLYPLVSRILFLVGGFLIWHQRWVLIDAQKTMFSLASYDAWNKIYSYIGMFLLSLSLVYFFILIFQSYIPYSTARDANHAYMFYPKMWAANYGYYWSEPWMITSPHIWYAYITYWFSLFLPTWWFLNISEDTIAIVMNALSWIFVLIFGTWLLAEMLRSQQDMYRKNSNSSFYIPLYIGIWLLLARLTSGMWAFLVFVDNKTDLGVMSLVIMWLYSGFVFIKSILQNLKKTEFERDIDTKRIWIVSGVFFAFAALAKPTALFDVVTFSWLLWVLWVWFLWSVWLIGLVLWCTSLIKFRGIKDYMSPDVWAYLLGLSSALWAIDMFRLFKRKFSYISRISLYRWCWFLVVYILMKSLYRVPRYILQESHFQPSTFVEKLLFSYEDKNLDTSALLLVADTNQSVPDTCSLIWLWYTSPARLYENLGEVWWNTYDEDVGRYVWYGWKWKPSDQRKKILPYTNPWRWFLFRPGCVWIFGDKEAWDICNNEYDADPFEVPLDIQARTINVDINASWDKVIYLPYKYLVLQNITYNRTLKNASSFYTDIGYIWLILLCLIPFWFLLGIYRKNKILSWLSLMTLWWWSIRFFIWWGILRYGIGIIVWTILSCVALMQECIYIYTDDEEKSMNSRCIYAIYWCIIVYICIQVFTNFMRLFWLGSNIISNSYKTNFIHKSQLLDTWERAMVNISPFTKEEAFDMQFWHYRPFVDAMNTRESNEGAVIAGTYTRYFIQDQKFIHYDQFLTWFQKYISDNDVCKTYLRMKDKSIKYIALDPNIGTVVQWEWNISLFHRFFAHIEDENIVSDGAVTMLTKMVRDGYARLSSTNNIGARYAFWLPEDSYQQLWETDEERLLNRAKMVVPRYRKSDPTVFNVLTQIAMQRIENGLLIDDLADIYGRQIDVEFVKSKLKYGQTLSAIKDLSPDERDILTQYLKILKEYQSNSEIAKASIQKLISFSIDNNNQILVIEIND